MLQLAYSREGWAFTTPAPMPPYGQGSPDGAAGCHTQPQQPWVVMVPFPAYGHVSPMVDLSRAILHHAGGSFRPLVAIPAFLYNRMFPSPQTAPAAAADDSAAKDPTPAETTTSDGLQLEEQDGVAFTSLPDGIGDSPDFCQIDAAMETQVSPHLDALLGRLGTVACVVADLLASWAFRVAERRGIQVSGFWPAMFATYSIISAAPLLVQKGLISESGIPVRTEAPVGEAVGGGAAASLLTTGDLPWLVGDEASQKARFTFWQRIFTRSQSLSSLIVNSFTKETDDGGELGGKHIENHPCRSSPRRRVIHLAAVLQQDHTTSTASKTDRNNSITFADAQVGNPHDDATGCLEWLARWAPSSVVYVSFGTWVGKIGEDNIREVALGLEAARMPFLLVLKDSWRNGLPIGFLDRVGDRGKLVSWAPQRKVLRHQAVGCFITHCGWNSTMEAIRFGKCLVCCPIAGDQFINSAHIVSIWKVGVQLPALERKCVEDCIVKVMKESEGSPKDGQDGSSMRSRMDNLRERMVGEQAYNKAKDNLESFLKGLNC